MPDMYPIMEVTCSVEGKTRLFEITLSQANINHFCADCPDFDRLLGKYRDVSFSIFPGPVSDKPLSFRVMSEGYYLYLGAPAPLIPPNVTPEHLDRLTEEYCQNIEKVMREIGRIPIEDDLGFKKVNLGYVTLKIKK